MRAPSDLLYAPHDDKSDRLTYGSRAFTKRDYEEPYFPLKLTTTMLTDG
jgi:hypothetical protein